MRTKSATLTVKRLQISRLKPHPRNPRKHPAPGDPAWDTLKKSIEHDYFDPIVWNKRNGMLVSGHLRSKILASSGFTEADCVVVDYDENTHLARMIAANKLQGEDNLDALQELLIGLRDQDFDLDLTGFDADALKDFSISPTDAELKEQFMVLIDCESEHQQLQMLDRLQKEGLKCKALIS